MKIRDKIIESILENDFPDNEEEQARHAREYTVAYFGKDIDELNWYASESYDLIKKAL